MVYGTAAQGAALDGSVSVEDSTGRIVSTPISGTSGEFSVSAAGLVPPFMLKATSADGQTVLYSAAAAAGRVNVSPMTHVGLMRLAALNKLKGPAALYAAPASFKTMLTSAALRDASPVALGRLMPAFVAGLPGAQAGTAPTYDPYATKLAVGDPVDRLLDQYPIRLSVSPAGIEVATQIDVATGIASVVSSSDTAAASGKQLAIAGVAGDVAAGSSTQLMATATFSNDVVQNVSANWTLVGEGQIDKHGKLTAPAVTSATSLSVRAQWFDGTHTLTAEDTVTVVPAFRPVSLEITGAGSGPVAANGDVMLVARVHWSDGSVTTPGAVWTWSGDASAVRLLGADGHLLAGAPSVDQPIEVHGSFTHQGVTVESSLNLVVAKLVRAVESLEINGFAAGTNLLAGAATDLVALAHWNDGTESIVPVDWYVQQSGGVTGRIQVQVSPSGHLSSTPYYLQPDADSANRSPDSFLVQAVYNGNQDGPLNSSQTAFTVKPLVKDPTGLVIRGALELNEGSTSVYQAFMQYSDGSEDEANATWVSGNEALLQPLGNAAFQAGEYAQKPAQSQVVTLDASLSYTYLDTNGRSVTKALLSKVDVAIAWVEPTLSSIALPADFDFVESGPDATVVKVTGQYVKLGRSFEQEVTGATLSSSNPRVASSANRLTVVTAPASASESWTTVTAKATDPNSGSEITASRQVTIARVATVAKQLLAYPWGPYGISTQFRAISSTGRLLDFNVTRDDIYRNGFRSPATLRQAPFLAGLTDFTQSQTVNNETQYVAAISFGELLVMRLQDLYDGGRAVTPVVRATSGVATSAALTYRAAANGAPATVLLYVRTADGAVVRFAMPAQLDRALQASDVVQETVMPGVFQTISAGSEHVLLTKADGSVFAEGSNAKGQIGDPDPNQTGWHSLFQTQAAQFDVSGTPTYSNFVGASAVVAERESSLATDATRLKGWGVVASTYYTMRGVSDTAAGMASAATNLYSAEGPARSQTRGAFVQADGSIVFRHALYTDSRFEDRDLWDGQRNYAKADWLPPALQIVACRRQLAGWPMAEELALMMPIVRTETDALYYLDGRPIVDAAGQTIVIP